ncbi:MAG TPA: hypothetical protein VGR97_02965 [Candidatus Acidoferrales bacterium]|nr:hypothetical protein [Candidatus Acidoferrales bacterium]
MLRTWPSGISTISTIAARNASLWLLGALIWPMAATAQGASQKACDLLTSSELTAAISGSVGSKSGSATAYHKGEFGVLGPDHDGVTYECTETVGTQRVTIRYSTSEVTAAGKKNSEARAKEMRESQKIYHVEYKNLNGSNCTTIVPIESSRVPGVPATTCQHEKGPYFVSVMVSATGSSSALPMEKVAPLAEKAASRLPAQ